MKMSFLVMAMVGCATVAIDVREDEASYQKYVTRTQMPFPVLHDREGVVSRAYAPMSDRPSAPNYLATRVRYQRVRELAVFFQSPVT